MASHGWPSGILIGAMAEHRARTLSELLPLTRSIGEKGPGAVGCVQVVESARARLRDYAVAAGDGANERLEQAKSAVDEMASSLSEKTAQATAKAKDEL